MPKKLRNNAPVNVVALCLEWLLAHRSVSQKDLARYKDILIRENPDPILLEQLHLLYSEELLRRKAL